MAASKKILIVGGGLAGSMLAAYSAEAGHQILLFDDGKPNAASRVAAGLFNIVTGKVAKKTHLAETLLESLQAFFRIPRFAHLAQHLHFLPIYRPYDSGQGYNTWMAKSMDPEFAEIVRHQGQAQMPEVIHNPLGGLEVLPCGWADPVAINEGIIEVLQEAGQLQKVSSRLDYGHIHPERSTYLGQHYDEIIFCEGVGLAANPWFKDVEIRPLKGQVLELQFEPGMPEDRIVNKQAFLIPKGKNIYTAGSTYEPRFEHDQATEEGIAAVSEAVAGAVKIPFKVLGAKASLRPTTPNRRPVLGRHPLFPSLVVFNGLGTKGVLQSPYHAKLLRDWLDGKQQDLPQELSSNRFFEKNP